MENVKHDLKKVFIIAIIIFLLCFLFTTLVMKLDMRNELINFSLVMIFIIPMTIYVHHEENQGLKHGLFFSENEIFIKAHKKTYKSSWDSLKVKRTFNFFNLFYFIKFSFPGLDRRYVFLLSPASEKSFLHLVHKYVPKDHKLYELTSEYLKK